MFTQAFEASTVLFSLFPVSYAKPGTSDWIWVTTLPAQPVSTERAVGFGHQRWDIENHGFNELVKGWHADHIYRHDPNAIECFLLIAFLAWVGLGSDGLSSSCYGPEEAFLALGAHQYLAVFLALLTALTVFVSPLSTSVSLVNTFPFAVESPATGVLPGPTPDSLTASPAFVSATATGPSFVPTICTVAVAQLSAPLPRRIA